MKSNFYFTTRKFETLELPFLEHIQEIRIRLFSLISITVLLTFLCFLEIKNIVQLLEAPIRDLKFFQISPGEYFFLTFKISFYSGLLFTSPFIIIQLILFLIPGITKQETKYILPLFCSSMVLFGSGLVFSYFVLIPAALNFFLNYSEEVLEPFLSFDQYFNFVLVIFYSTGLAFQTPIIQVLLGLANIISVFQMLKIWKYVALMATILGAILTPSTDPITQLFLSFAILFLYFVGLGVLFLIKN